MSNIPIPCLAFLLTMSLALPALSADDWSPESGGASWERIPRLQSVASTSATDTQFVIDCCHSEEVVERLAAISWIARTQNVRHVAELQRLLSDSVREVRKLAFEALLAMPHPDAATSVLKAIDTMPDLTAGSLEDLSYRRPGLVPRHDSQRLEMLSTLLPDERRDWTAHLLDQKEWISQYAQERKEVARYQVWLNSSVMQLGGSLTLALKPAGSGANDAEPPERMIANRIPDLKRARNRLSDILYDSAELKRTQAAGRQWQYELTPRYRPVAVGIYAFSAASTEESSHGVEGFPFFIRVNRSLQDEREIPQLLKRLPDHEAALRLGLLRVRDAAPQLIEQFRSMPPGCEQSEIAAALAMVERPRRSSISRRFAVKIQALMWDRC